MLHNNMKFNNSIIRERKLYLLEILEKRMWYFFQINSMQEAEILKGSDWG